MDKSDLHAFDPRQPWSISGNRLPHWDQAGAVCFITWRVADSLPEEVLLRWQRERDEMLRNAGAIDEQRRTTSGFGKTGLRSGTGLRKRPNGTPVAAWHRLQWSLSERFDEYLNAGYGACVLKNPELQRIVSDSLRKFDGDRYLLSDFVVMPNHVHLLAAFQTEGTLRRQCANWKRYTARRINEQIGRSGPFWQEDDFDHLVRSLDYFERYREYIASNGQRARLPQTDYLWWTNPIVGGFLRNPPSTDNAC